MPIVVTSLAFVVAVLCAGVMGYAIQRGEIGRAHV